MMKIEIRIKNNIVIVFLKDRKNILDKVAFPEERNLAEKLLPSIDKLLRRNKLSTEDIESMALKADLDDSYTTFRIAKSVVDSFNWARKVR